MASGGTTLDLLPDGRVIFDSMSGRQNLREYALDGRGPPRWITHGTINDRQPVFAPGGEWVVFSSNRSGNLDLWAVSTRSGVVRSITDDPADDWDPGFSPDGRSLLWSSNRSGNLEIWASNPDGTGAHQVTHDGVDAQNPTETRDGKWIVYSCANRKHPGLWRIHPDGSGAELLAPGAVQIPEVSPDGTYATYVNTVPVDVQPPRDPPGRRRGHDLRGPSRTPAQDLGPARSLAMDPGRQAASSSPGRTRRAWTASSSRTSFRAKDTTSTRRPFAGFDPDWITESLGLSPDGKRLVLSESERVFSLMIAEGVQGLGRKRPR